MANPSGAPEGRPSDPRELIFEVDCETTHVRKKEWWFIPARILFSLAAGGLSTWAYRVIAELATERFGPIFPGWTFYAMLVISFLFGTVFMYRWLNKN